MFVRAVVFSLQMKNQDAKNGPRVFLVAKIFICCIHDAQDLHTKTLKRHSIAPRAPMSVTTGRFMIDLVAEMPLEKTGSGFLLRKERL